MTGSVAHPGYTRPPWSLPPSWAAATSTRRHSTPIPEREGRWIRRRSKTAGGNHGTGKAGRFGWLHCTVIVAIYCGTVLVSWLFFTCNIVASHCERRPSAHSYLVCQSWNNKRRQPCAWRQQRATGRGKSTWIDTVNQSLQVKDLILLEMVIQNQYLRRSKTRFYWVFGLVGNR